MKINRLFFYFFFYWFARHLPSSSTRIVGNAARRLRTWCCRHLFSYVGDNVNIEKGAKFGSGAGIKIGNNSGIGINASMPTAITIGDDVMMGHEVLVLNRNHRFDRTDIPMRLQAYTGISDVEIGDDVWLGTRVTILPGVKIGKGSIVGACSVVTKDVPEFSVVAGNPAKIIRSRLTEKA